MWKDTGCWGERTTRYTAVETPTAGAETALSFQDTHRKLAHFNQTCHIPQPRCNSSEAFMLLAPYLAHSTEGKRNDMGFFFTAANDTKSVTQPWAQKCKSVVVLCTICCMLAIYWRLPNLLMFSRAKRSCLSLPDTASFINPALSRRPRKISAFWGNESQRNGEAGAFSVRWGFCADSYTPSFFSGWLWAAPGVTGSWSNGGRLTDAYFQPWKLHIKKIDGMDSGWAWDKLLGCESPQWVRRLSARLICHVTLTSLPSY